MNARRGKRPSPPGIAPGDDVESMIRVDHAGEYGAVRIYKGQLAVLAARRSARDAAQTVRRMARQEEDHLKAFNKLITAHEVRPTALTPIWHVAGFTLGAATAFMGEKAAMACTVAVENVIDAHYAQQIARLENDDALRAQIAQFRADEIAHRDEALAKGAEDTPGYSLLSAAIKTGCRLAIKLSERL